MFKHLITTILALVSSLILSSNAGAQCHPGAHWALEEIYSNADGSIQFLVLVRVEIDDADGPPLAGTTLIASNGATENAYTFPSDLPGRKNGTFILVGTEGFAGLNLLKPDFVVPNGFVFVRNGSVRLGGTPWCAGPIQYAVLPTDGVNAYWPNAFGDSDAGPFTAVAVNSAHSFGHGSYTFTPNYGGLWWNSPAGSESGWGIVVEHQRDIVFAAWATYDMDGSPAWFVMPRADLYEPGPADDIAPNTTWQGAMYRMTGPAFSALPFDPAAVTATHVGSGGFHFPRSTDNGIGTFYYGINGTSAYKSITRQVFADPVSVCVEGGTPGPTPNFQGMWWNASEAGWGLHLSHQGDVIFAVWFTYDAAGKATWLAMIARKTAPNSYAGAIYRTTGPAFSAPVFDPAAVTATQVGTATLTFGDRYSGAFSFVCGGCGVDGVAQTKDITRQIFATPPAVCN